MNTNFVGKFANGIKKFFGLNKDVVKPIRKLIPVEDTSGQFGHSSGGTAPTFSRKAWKLRKNRLFMTKESRKKNR